MAAHVIAQPYQSDGLSDVATSHDEIDGEVASADRDGLLREKDDVSNARGYNAEHGESIAMAETVRQEGGHETRHCGNNVDRDRKDLCTDGSPAQFAENCWSEEGSAVARIIDSEIHQNSVNS